MKERIWIEELFSFAFEFFIFFESEQRIKQIPVLCLNMNSTIPEKFQAAASCVWFSCICTCVSGCLRIELSPVVWFLARVSCKVALHASRSGSVRLICLFSFHFSFRRRSLCGLFFWRRSIRCRSANTGTNRMSASHMHMTEHSYKYME